MKITSGKYKGRIIAAPKGLDIRPTADKVRQAVFNSLLSHDLPEGAQVLDMFAGTGALGLEALSRGAAFCTFIDKNPVALKCLSRNIQALGLSSCSKVLAKDSTKIGEKALDFLPADLVFIDPPYRQNLALPALMAAVKDGWIAAGAVCVIEAEKQTDIFVPEVFTLLAKKKYGDTQVVFCRYGASPFASTPL